MKRLIFLLCLAMRGCQPAYAANSPVIPAADAVIIATAARQYNLSPWQTKLHRAIRVTENGAPGLEFGVGDGIKGHPARRFAGNHAESLRVQAEWAAGSIRKRCPSPEYLEAFSRRYCPPNHRWWYATVVNKLEKL